MSISFVNAIPLLAMFVLGCFIGYIEGRIRGRASK